MSPERVGRQDATNSDTLQVVSLFSRHPASYSVFLLEWFHPACLPSWEWWGSVSSCQLCVLLLQAERKTTGTGRNSIHTPGFLTYGWELGNLVS